MAVLAEFPLDRVAHGFVVSFASSVQQVDLRVIKDVCDISDVLNADFRAIYKLNLRVKHFAERARNILDQLVLVASRLLPDPVLTIELPLRRHENVLILFLVLQVFRLPDAAEQPVRAGR